MPIKETKTPHGVTSRKPPKSIKNRKQFPDLSGDGEVTKKDILIGRGVIKKKDGGPVRGKARGMGAATKGGGYNI